MSNIAREIEAAEARLKAAGIPLPEPSGCRFCDFGMGQRGMDRCAKCHGTGSVFWAGSRMCPNTEAGYLDACLHSIPESAA